VKFGTRTLSYREICILQKRMRQVLRKHSSQRININGVTSQATMVIKTHPYERRFCERKNATVQQNQFIKEEKLPRSNKQVGMAVLIFIDDALMCLITLHVQEQLSQNKYQFYISLRCNLRGHQTCENFTTQKRKVNGHLFLIRDLFISTKFYCYDPK